MQKVLDLLAIPVFRDDGPNYVYLDPASKEWSPFDMDDDIQYMTIPKSLLFPEPPPIQYLTIGDARNMRPNDHEKVIEHDGQFPVEIFGPKWSSHFEEGNTLVEKMLDDEVDDDEIFKWGGSDHHYIKVTEALLKWTALVAKRMKMLSQPQFVSRCETIRKDISPLLRNLDRQVDQEGKEMRKLETKIKQREENIKKISRERTQIEEEAFNRLIDEMPA